jgi:hypothetical protein
MGLTPFARNLVIVFFLLTFLSLYYPFSDFLPFLPTIILSSIFLIYVAFAQSSRCLDPTSTSFDLVLINLNRFLQGKAPTPGQLSCISYFAPGNLPTQSEAIESMTKLATLYPRFAKIPVQKTNFVESFWPSKTFQNFDVTKHIKVHSRAGRGEVLEQEISTLVNTLVDLSQPWWAVDILQSEDENGGGAVVVRIHHSIGDGLRLVKAFGTVLLFEDGSPARLEILNRISTNKKLQKPTHNNPIHFLRDFFSALTLDQLPPESPTPLHHPNTLLPSNTPRTVNTSWAPFSHIKDIRDICPNGTTINDVILTLFCFAIRKYAAERGATISPHATMRAMCAFSLPDGFAPIKGDTYNNFLMPTLCLPVNASDRLQCLQKVKDVMAELKTSMVGPIQMRLMEFLGRLGLDAVAANSQIEIFKKHSFVYSNVPGFEQPFFMFNTKRQVWFLLLFF